MRLLDRLEGWFGRFAIPNLTQIVIVAQVLVYATYLRPGPGDRFGNPDAFQYLILIPAKVMQGEAWRLISFVAVPPIDNIVFMVFGWYLFYLMGTALERYWGTFRYNLFLLSGWTATVAVSFLQPNAPASPAFLGGSVFLAFAHLNPYFQLYVFFLFPVQIRWLALLTWIGYAVALIFGPWVVKLTVLASVLNFLLFFWGDILERVLTARRYMTGQATRFGMAGHQEALRHRCRVCGLTNVDDRTMDFRYCSKCDDGACYCSAHLRDHPHTTAIKRA